MSAALQPCLPPVHSTPHTRANPHHHAQWCTPPAPSHSPRWGSAPRQRGNRQSLSTLFYEGTAIWGGFAPGTGESGRLTLAPNAQPSGWFRFKSGEHSGGFNFLQGYEGAVETLGTKACTNH